MPTGLTASLRAGVGSHRNASARLPVAKKSRAERQRAVRRPRNTLPKIRWAGTKRPREPRCCRHTRVATPLECVSGLCTSSPNLQQPPLPAVCTHGPQHSEECWQGWYARSNYQLGRSRACERSLSKSWKGQGKEHYLDVGTSHEKLQSVREDGGWESPRAKRTTQKCEAS